MEYLIIIISAVFVNNIVLAQFLGICPFLGVSNKVSTATGMSAAVVFVITLSTLVTYLIDHYILASLDITFMRTIVFILVIAALVQMVEIILKKISPSLYQALGIFLPLITTNCTVLGVAISVVTKEFTFGGEAHLLNLGETVVYAASSAASSWTWYPFPRHSKVLPSHWSRPVSWPWRLWDSADWYRVWLL